MGKEKKSGRKKLTVEKLLLATAILNLVKALLDLVSRLTEQG